MAEKLRQTQLERNDLRTRLAVDHRNFNSSKEELKMTVQTLEDQVETLKLTYEARLGKMQAEFDIIQSTLARFI